MTTAPPRRRKQPATTFSNSTQPSSRPALLSIFGGKITTYRRLAEAALAILSRHLPPARKAAGWTGQDALPGGDFPTDGFESLVNETAARYPFLARDTVRRLVRAYGTRAERLLGGAKTQSDLGTDFRRRPDRSRGPLSRQKRMGDERRRRRLAALQTGIANVGGRGQGSRRLSRSLAGSAADGRSERGKRRVTFVLENISLSVGQETVIDDVSLTLDQGSMNVLLGPTLSGKTTLMRLMAGLDRPTTGRLIEDGVDVTNVPVRRRSVAMVYQQFVNYPSLTVYENIASPLRVAGLGRAEIDARVKRSGAFVAARQSSAAPARAAVRRTAAAHGDCSRARQARQTGSARRAAGQPRL